MLSTGGVCVEVVEWKNREIGGEGSGRRARTCWTAVFIYKSGAGAGDGVEDAQSVNLQLCSAAAARAWGRSCPAAQL